MVCPAVLLHYVPSWAKPLLLVPESYYVNLLFELGGAALPCVIIMTHMQVMVNAFSS